MKIGEVTLTTMEEEMHDYFVEYSQDINEAYLQAGEDNLIIKVHFKLSPKDRGSEVETSINFVKEKVNVKKKKIVNEDQGNLFENAA